MSIVKYKNQSGVTYAYEQTSVYDPEKKQSRPKRKYLGRVDPETGEIISTEGKKGRPPKAKEAATPISPDSLDFKCLYQKVCDELKESQKQNGELQREKEALETRIRQLSELLRSFQEKISEILP